MLAERRRQVIEETYVDPEKRATEEMAENDLNLFSEFLRVMLVRTNDREDVEKMIDEAKTEMRVEHINTGDLNAMEVP